MVENHKLIIFGGSGYIGSHLIERLKKSNRKFLTAGRSLENDLFLDLRDPDPDALAVLSTGDTVIFLAAISSPEFCSKFYDDAYRINVTNTCKVIRSLLAKNIRVLFASSDVVYGPTDQAVDELSSVYPSSPYASMKTSVEETFAGDPNFNVMRLSYVWSIDDKFTQFVVGSAKKQERIDVFHPFIRSIVTLHDVLDFITCYCTSPERFPPITNLAGTEFMSRVDLMQELNKYLDVEYTILYPEKEFFKHRPEKILMESRFLASILGREPEQVALRIKNSFTQGEGV